MDQSKVEQALKVSELLKKYLKEELSDREFQELDQWFAEHPQGRHDLQHLLEQKLTDYSNDNAKTFDSAAPYDRLISRIKDNEQHQMLKVIRRKRFYQFAAAAVVLIVFAVGLLVLTTRDHDVVLKNNNVALLDTAKGAAVELTLANGKKLNLEAQRDGVIMSENQIVIAKKNNQLLSYQSVKENNETETSTELNTLTVPRGKQYQLILPDGSKVWMNAQSTLSFPSNFNKKERVVELTGEAYFEVNHFSKWPFHVKTQHQKVEVLGTIFNVSAYGDETQTVTTLLSGSVRVSDQTQMQMLKPGQFAAKFKGKDGFSIATANISETIAWKNGLLVFKDEKIENLTQSLARTFDVDFDIDPRIKGQHFGGSFVIKNGLTNLLRNLEQTDAIHFKVEGRRIRVMP